MRTYWRDTWLETPRPHPVPGSTLIEVEATAPLRPLGAAHGREFGRPARKVASFLVTDGPAATLRKARSKRAEAVYSGDYHLVVAVGRDDEGRRLLALVPRAPRCASFILATTALTRPVPGDFDLAAAAAAARPRSAGLPGLAQSYLYSGMDPPPELTALLDALVAEAQPRAAGAETITAPTAAHSSELLSLRNTATAYPHLAVLGAGDYVRIEVASALAGASLERAILADREPQIAALAATELGFAAATTDAEAAVDSLAGRGLVLVATAHDSHASLAARALEAGHRVICEKPACVTLADLDELHAAARRRPGELEVGFNRRFNPLVERARRELAREQGPATIVATIREVDITPDHWYLWPNQGTRVAGNLCHWIDLALHLLGPGPSVTEIAVSPQVSHEPGGIDAERAFTLALDDGSTVLLLPTARGDSIRGVQESIEARRGALTLRLDDLWKLSGLRAGRPIRRRTFFRDKGHGRMYQEFLARFGNGHPASYPLDDLRRVGEAQIAASSLLRSGRPAGSLTELLELARAA